MVKKFNVLFNTNKFYIDSFLPELKEMIGNLIYSSPNLLVYEKNNLEVMINNQGTVSITSADEISDNLNDVIATILNEYKELTLLSKRFAAEESFKIISPKNMSSAIIKQLTALDYKTEVTNTFDNHTLRVVLE